MRNDRKSLEFYQLTHFTCYRNSVKKCYFGCTLIFIFCGKFQRTEDNVFKVFYDRLNNKFDIEKLQVENLTFPHT
jgi:hypothetical protein